MCAGLVSETLVQNLAMEGINLPDTVVQRGLDSYVLHSDAGTVRIESIRHERRIATTFRGMGPRGLKEINGSGLDAHLLDLALKKGAQHIRARIDAVDWIANPADPDPKASLVGCRTQGGMQVYDLLAVTTGVNTSALKLFQGLNLGYEPPGTNKCFVREYYLGEELVTQYMGSAMHTFMLKIPRVKLAALVPKGDYVSLILIGQDIDTDLIQTVLSDPAVKACFPPGFDWNQEACHCSPRINIRASLHPYGNRVIFIGDSAVTRLYKDGIGAAYRAAKVAAMTAVFDGISAGDFERHYLQTCQTMESDNRIGKLLFSIIGQIERFRFGRRAVLRLVRDEQSRVNDQRWMSTILWDLFTGSASYREIFWRCVHPGFWIRLLGSLAVSLVESRPDLRIHRSAVLAWARRQLDSQ